MRASDMKGKAALVTGSASGLGRATAVALAKAGTNVFLVDINQPGLEETAIRLSALGTKAHIHHADLAVAANCHAAVAAAVETFGRLDALCNVAGMIVFAHAHEMKAADWEKTLAVNLSAPFYLIQAAIPHLLKTEGAVVNVTSCGAFVGEAYLAAYCATKAGLNHLTKSLAMEYVHRPIRFNAVAPGGMATGLTAELKFPDGMEHSLIQRYSGLRGMVEVDDVADVVAFLASDASRGFHGACISIDKGITAG